MATCAAAAPPDVTDGVTLLTLLLLSLSTLLFLHKQHMLDYAHILMHAFGAPPERTQSANAQHVWVARLARPSLAPARRSSQSVRRARNVLSPHLRSPSGMFGQLPTSQFPTAKLESGTRRVAGAAFLYQGCHALPAPSAAAELLRLFLL